MKVAESGAARRLPLAGAELCTRPPLARPEKRKTFLLFDGGEEEEEEIEEEDSHSLLPLQVTEPTILG